MTVTRPLPPRMGHRGSLVVLAALLSLLLAACGGRRSERSPSQVPIMAPPPVVVTRPANPGAVIAAPTPDPAARRDATEAAPASPAESPVAARAVLPPVPAAPRTAAEWDPAEPDQHGFAGDRYVGLLTPDEVDILRLRSRGDLVSHLSRFLTEKEKENLRRREAELTEIGADPLRIGE